MGRGFLVFIALISLGLEIGNASELPSQFDVRNYLPFVNPVRDQLNCTNPTALTASFALEVAAAMKGFWVPPLSAQQIVSCDTRNAGCKGSGLDLDYLVGDGLVRESDFPYIGKPVPCPPSLANPLRAKAWGNIERSSQYWDVDEIKAAIYRFGSVVATMHIDRAFINYPGGVFADCSAGAPNHLVNIIGWNDDESYWIVRNSWGSHWGEDGYIRMAYTCDSLGAQVTFVEASDSMPL